MKTVLLTTDTLHHTRFALQLAPEFPWQTIFVETNRLPPPFPVEHPFEAVREEFERSLWFGGQPEDLNAAAPVICVGSINDNDAIRRLRDCAPDIIVVFGTGLLKNPILKAVQVPFMNLHGGDPERYRGLDSHLWAIYHRDFAGLETTLHHVNPALDDGAIIERMFIPVRRDMPLHELRASNTEVCISLTKAAPDKFAHGQRLPSVNQRSKGRYYSFMPSVLKEICRKHFQQYTRGL